MEPHVIKIHMMMLQVVLEHLAGGPGRFLSDSCSPDARVCSRGEVDFLCSGHGGNFPDDVRR